MDNTKIILVDDHEVVRTGIVAGLMIDNSIEVVGEAANSDELFNLLENIIPDVVILDISMPGKSGIEVCKILKDEYSYIKVVIFSGSFEEKQIFEALEAGTDAFLPKDASNIELIEAIKKIKSGTTYLSKRLPENLIAKYIHHKKISETENPLTSRETEIIKHLANGLSHKQIAEILFISHKTVEKHKRNLMKKMELKSTADIVKYAIKNNLISL